MTMMGGPGRADGSGAGVRPPGTARTSEGRCVGCSRGSAPSDSSS